MHIHVYMKDAFLVIMSRKLLFKIIIIRFTFIRGYIHIYTIIILNYMTVMYQNLEIFTA